MKKVLSVILCLAMMIPALGSAETADASNRGVIEAALDLSQNTNQAWTYDSAADAWVLSVVSYVAYPVAPDYQGMSLAVPGTYVTGIDTDGDGAADVSSTQASGEVKGRLVIDSESSVTSSNGQVYTAATAPVLFETGGGAYAAQSNKTASTTYAADGLIYMVAGNRGKQSTATLADGSTVYTGDSPDMVVDGKAAIRFLRYNIALGNLPGSAEYLVVTGGSGAGAHTMMVASTGDNDVFYSYLADIGAAGVYRGADGAFEAGISDAVWGALGYSPITSLAEADSAMAFEYTLDTNYSFNTSFQKELAAYLSREYMEYINAQGLKVSEESAGFDLDGDGALGSTVALTIEYDPAAHPETNGYYGSYLDLYLAVFTKSLQSYLDRLDYAEGWTWFNADGSSMADEEVTAMSAADKAAAFIEGRVAAASNAGSNGMMGGRGGNFGGNGQRVGTPGAGTTQSAGSGIDSANYASYEEMLAAYQADVAAVLAGDEYGNDQVALYHPIQWIGSEGTTLPVWAREMNGASEGDIAMFNSLNIWIALLNAGVDAEIEWQWNGGHVPGEILGDSVVLRIDEMYGKYADGAVPVQKAEAAPLTGNGTAETATGKDISGWVTMDEAGHVSFSLADIAAYRTAGAKKAMPAFDVIDYGQEDYVFGTDETDARHWDALVLKVLEEHQAELEGLFNAN